MVLSVKVGFFDANTSTGNQTISGVGFTPKLVLLSSASTVGFGAVAASFYSMFSAAASASQRWAVGCFGQDAVTASASNSVRWMQSKFGHQSDTTPTTTLAFELVTMNADGFTINISTAQASLRRFCYLALGGDAIDNVKVGTIDVSAGTGAEAYTGVGFEPDLMIFGASIPDTTLGVATNSVFSLGVAASSTSRAAFSNSNNDNQATNTRSDGVLVADGCILHTFDDVVAVKCDFTSMDADGFTLNRTVSDGGSYKVGYVAIKGDDLLIKIGTETQKTSTGTKATAGVGFPPEVLAVFSACRTSSGSVTAHYRGSVGFTDGVTDLCAQWGFEDGVATSRGTKNTAQKVMASASNSGGTVTTQAEAGLDSFDSDGFTLDWTTADATAREFFFLALASVASVNVTAGLGEGGGFGNVPTVIPQEVVAAAGIGDGSGLGFAPTFQAGTDAVVTAGLGEGSGLGFSPRMSNVGSTSDTLVFSERYFAENEYLAETIRSRIRRSVGDD